MPTAIVTGATGILGRAIVAELAKYPETWTKIYAVSRSKTEIWSKNVEHIRVDLTGSVEEISKQMDNVATDVLFFSAYLQGGSEQEMCDSNGTMLRNFIRGIKMSSKEGSDGIKRVILVTGAKQYGVHFGPPKIPMEETDPWLSGPDRPPNFYYVQQDILKEESASMNWDWVVTFPNDVIGVAKGNFMNLATTLGLYCAVTKELGQQLYWPGSETFYTSVDSFTSADFHAKFCLWAAQQGSNVSNETFNVVNGDVQSWQTMFPKVGKKFGLTIPPDQFKRQAPDRSLMELSSNPPIKDFETEMGLQGKVSKVSVEQRVDLVRWSQREDVKQAWNKLADREGLEHESFEKATWGFLGFAIGRPFDMVISMSKARKAGFTDYQDTWESLDATLTELSKEKVLPKT